MSAEIKNGLTLDALHEEITKELFPFITFRVQMGNEIVSNVTIPNCRFRETDNKDLIEARSCDCGGTICGNPTQSLFLSKNQMKNYLLIEKNSINFYVFLYILHNQEI
jgi:hypothetical protein